MFPHSGGRGGVSSPVSLPCKRTQKDAHTCIHIHQITTRGRAEQVQTEESRERGVKHSLFLAQELEAKGGHGSHRDPRRAFAAAHARGAHQLWHRSDPQQRGTELHAGRKDARARLWTPDIQHLREWRCEWRLHLR